MHRLVIAEGRDFPELASTFWRLGPGRGYQMLRDYLEVQQQHGIIHCEDTDRAVEVWFGLLVGATSMRQNLGLASFTRTAPVVYSVGSPPLPTSARDIAGWLQAHYDEQIEQTDSLLLQWQATARP